MNSKPPFDIDGALSEILQAFAKRVEQVPRAATYGWSSEQSAVKSLIASVLDEVIGSDVVENPEQADQGINLPYDYGVARRAGANNLRSEMRAKRKEMGLE